MSRFDILMDRVKPEPPKAEALDNKCVICGKIICEHLGTAPKKDPQNNSQLSQELMNDLQTIHGINLQPSPELTLTLPNGIGIRISLDRLNFDPDPRRNHPLSSQQLQIDLSPEETRVLLENFRNTPGVSNNNYFQRIYNDIMGILRREALNVSV